VVEKVDAMKLIERVFMIREKAGSGIDEDPYRWVRVFVYADTLEEICRFDEFEQDLLRNPLK
jgi:hypothetical protein